MNGKHLYFKYSEICRIRTDAKLIVPTILVSHAIVNNHSFKVCLVIRSELKYTTLTSFMIKINDFQDQLLNSNYYYSSKRSAVLRGSNNLLFFLCLFFLFLRKQNIFMIMKTQANFNQCSNIDAWKSCRHSINFHCTF